MSFREKILRILTIPFVLAGLFYFHIERAFRYGYNWEREQMEPVKRLPMTIDL